MGCEEISGICSGHNTTDQTDIGAAHKKVVQMDLLSRNFTKKLEKELRLNGNSELYGKTLTHTKIYMGRIHGQSDDEWVTVEQYING